MWIKICGITHPDDAELALDAGADAIGLNFVPGTSRAVDVETARRIIERVAGRLELVGVIADLPLEAARSLRDALGLDSLQLHGDESPELVAALLPHAYKALRVGEPADVARAELYAGERILVDAKVEGRLGGTGRRVAPELVRGLAARRSVILAGGLGPGSVAAAIAAAGPFGVDVASGVERDGQPRRKDPDKVAAFVREARRSLDRLR